MKKVVTFLIPLILTCFGANNTNAQCTNIVPNGGFEDFSQLPDDDCDWSLATGWTNASNGQQCNSSNGTPDYYHNYGDGAYSELPSNYFGVLNAAEGEAVMGIAGYLSFIDDAREYIGVQLSCPLQVGELYTISIDITRGTSNIDCVANNGYGLLLSQTETLQPNGCNCLINASPQFIIPDIIDFEEWQTYSFDFVADEPYEFLTFGNFLSDSEVSFVDIGNPGFFNLSYVFVDNVSIMPMSILLDAEWGNASIEVTAFEKLAVKWTTLSEVNSSHFLLQSSLDLNQWETVGTTAAAGTSSSELTYSLLLNQPREAITYYRVVEVDANGTPNYGPLLYWVNENQTVFSWYPDRQELAINVEIPTQVSLYNSSGMLVRNFQLNEPSVVSLNNLPKGVYVISDGVHFLRFPVTY